MAGGHVALLGMKVPLILWPENAFEWAVDERNRMTTQRLAAAITCVGATLGQDLRTAAKGERLHDYDLDCSFVANASSMQKLSESLSEAFHASAIFAVYSDSGRHEPVQLGASHKPEAELAPQYYDVDPSIQPFAVGGAGNGEKANRITAELRARIREQAGSRRPVINPIESAVWSLLPLYEDGVVACGLFVQSDICESVHRALRPAIIEAFDQVPLELRCSTEELLVFLSVGAVRRVGESIVRQLYAYFAS